MLTINKQSIIIFYLNVATNTGVLMTPEQTNVKREDLVGFATQGLIR